MSLNLKNIKSDIGISKMCLSPFRNLFNDEIYYNSAAYHAQQATEKCLKIILLKYYCVDGTSKRYRTHNISSLLAYLNECAKESAKEIPIIIPQVIIDNSIDITSWEANTRYGDDMVLLRKSIKEVIRADEFMERQLRSLF